MTNSSNNTQDTYLLAHLDDQLLGVDVGLEVRVRLATSVLILGKCGLGIITFSLGLGPRQHRRHTDEDLGLFEGHHLRIEH